MIVWALKHLQYIKLNGQGDNVQETCENARVLSIGTDNKNELKIQTHKKLILYLTYE